jgi:hypothetical protein
VAVYGRGPLDHGPGYQLRGRFPAEEVTGLPSSADGFRKMERHVAAPAMVMLSSARREVWSAQNSEIGRFL